MGLYPIRSEAQSDTQGLESASVELLTSSAEAELRATVAMTSPSTTHAIMSSVISTFPQSLYALVSTPALPLSLSALISILVPSPSPPQRDNHYSGYCLSYKCSHGSKDFDYGSGWTHYVIHRSFSSSCWKGKWSDAFTVCCSCCVSISPSKLLAPRRWFYQAGKLPCWLQQQILLLRLSFCQAYRRPNKKLSKGVAESLELLVQLPSMREPSPTTGILRFPRPKVVALIVDLSSSIEDAWDESLPEGEFLRATESSPSITIAEGDHFISLYQ